jgi:hypothetical protein
MTQDNSDGIKLSWQVGGLIAGSLIAIASFMPWITVIAPFVGSMGISGFEGDGKISLILGIGVIVAFLIRHKVTAVVTSGLAIALAGFELVNISNGISEATAASEGMAHASVGAGLWALVLASVLALVAAIKDDGLRRTKSTAEVDTVTSGVTGNAFNRNV